MTLYSRARSLSLLCAGFLAGHSYGWTQSWWIEGGPVFRGGMKAKAEGSSYTQALGLHDPLASGHPTDPTGLGSATAYADRTYDNGYVKLDPGTGNPTSLDPNTTWNWGFNNPAQYNSAAQTLSFQKQGTPGYNTLQNGTPGKDDEFWGAGFQIVAGLPLLHSGPWNLDLSLGFQGIWGGTESFNVSTYREDVRQSTVTDVYDVSGIGTAGFPASGFQGTYLGPFDNPPVVPSPVIPNIPQSRSASMSAALSTSYNTINFNVDQDLYQFSLGPKIGFAASQHIQLHLRPTVSLNIVDASVKRTELFVQAPAGGASTVLNQWADHASRQDVYFGLGAVGGVDLDFGKGYYGGVFGGYEWVSASVKVSVGPNNVLLDASGWAVGLTVGKRF
jgi:hypothetical protein